MTDADKSKIILLGQLATFKTLLSSNIDTLSTKVAALEALVESDSDGAINKFNEIVAFLKNITDSQTLEGIVNGINTNIAKKADKATTLAGYGITDAKIAGGVITLGGNTITPLTQHQDISGKVDKVSGKGLSTHDYTDADKAKVDALVYATDTDIQGLFS